MRYRLIDRRIIIELIEILTIVIEPQPPEQTLVKQVLPEEIIYPAPTSDVQSGRGGDPTNKDRAP